MVSYCATIKIYSGVALLNVRLVDSGMVFFAQDAATDGVDPVLHAKFAAQLACKILETAAGCCCFPSR